MKNFLLIQLRQIGDVVLTTPIARIIKEALPDSRVTFLTEGPSLSLLQNNPYIDEIIVSDRKDGFIGTLKTVFKLYRRKFDVIIDSMSNPRSAVLAFGSRAPLRIAYRKKWRGIMYTHQIKPASPYAADYKKDLLTPLGISSQWNRPEIFLSPEEINWGQRLREQLIRPGHDHLVTIDPSHRRYTRRWPASSFGVFCQLLADRYNATPVVLWGPGERPLAAEVVSVSKDNAVLAPYTDLRQSAALTAAADLHMGNCSAPRHIAVAVKTPSFTILGATSYGWTHPDYNHTDVSLGIECQPCNQNHCDIDIACLKGFTAEMVFEKFVSWSEDVLQWRQIRR
jgi:ADP-heptose:LPS heptosyltransferase